MRLIYTARAGRDLVRLREFIRKNNPCAAEQASHKLQKSILSLVDQPSQGRCVEGLEGFRELVTRCYVVRYRVLPDELVILNIWHSKEAR